jgi:hypothetical protein
VPPLPLLLPPPGRPPGGVLFKLFATLQQRRQLALELYLQASILGSQPNRLNQLPNSFTRSRNGIRHTECLGPKL